MEKKPRNRKLKGAPMHPDDAALRKTCKVCERELPIDKFYVGTSKYGRRGECELCKNLKSIDYFYEKWEKQRFTNSRWQKINKKDKNRNNRAYYKRNRDAILAKSRARKTENAHRSGPCSESPLPQVQNQEAGSPPAQISEFRGHQDYCLLVSCGPIYTFLWYCQIKMLFLLGIMGNI